MTLLRLNNDHIESDLILVTCSCSPLWGLGLKACAESLNVMIRCQTPKRHALTHIEVFAVLHRSMKELSVHIYKINICIENLVPSDTSRSLLNCTASNHALSTLISKFWFFTLRFFARLHSFDTCVIRHEISSTHFAHTSEDSVTRLHSSDSKIIVLVILAVNICFDAAFEDLTAIVYS